MLECFGERALEIVSNRMEEWGSEKLKGKPLEINLKKMKLIKYILRIAYKPKQLIYNRHKVDPLSKQPDQTIDR